MFRHTRAILREDVAINKTFMIQRQTRQWNYNTTHILNVHTQLVVAQPNVATDLIYEMSSVCPKYRRLCGPHTRS